MKKTVVLLVVLMLVSLMFSSLALAAEVVDTPLARESAEAEGAGEDDFVGKDMELEEGEVGIVSLPEADPNNAPDSDGEVRTISADDEADLEEDYVGRDLELEEGEMGIVSVDEGSQEQGASNLPLYGAIALAAAAIAFFAYKKIIA